MLLYLGMSTKKVIRSILGIIGFGLLVWGVLLPLVNRRTANESLDSISQKKPPTAVTTTSDQVVNSPPSTSPMITTLRSGSFKSLRGQRTSGTVTIVKNEAGSIFVRLEEDFSVSSGPDLYVGFGNGGRVDEASLVSLLKATSGSQNYELPGGFDVSKYSQVFIYCKAFAYPFGSADLK